MRFLPVLMLGTLVPTAGTAHQVSWHAAARYNVSTASPDYRSRVEIGLRYRPMLTPRLGLDLGGLLQFENGLPVQERLRYEGNWVRHWGAGVRWNVSRPINPARVKYTLIASIQRTTRGYAIKDAADDQGYYVSPAVGVEVGYQKFGAKLEIAPWAVKSWRLGAKDLLVRARYGRLSLTVAHVTPSKDQTACVTPYRDEWRGGVTVQCVGGKPAWGVVTALRVVGPFTVSSGWDLLPGDRHRNALRPVAFAGIGVQVDGGRK